MKFLLTFKPLKHFFFGNNKTFSDDYFAVSEYFPQNTQLLGALRLLIAEQHGLMKVYKKGKWCSEPEKLKALTGTATSSDFFTNSDLGKIKNLSQMFIVSKDLNDAYFPTPFDVRIELEKKGTSIMGEDGAIHIMPYPQKAKLSYYELDTINESYFVKNYDAKNYSSQMLGNKNFWSFYLNKESRAINAVQYFEKNDEQYHGVFIPNIQVGIELKNKQTVDKQFYSKIDYQLDSKFLFGCVIELEEEIIANGIIQIGAESSLFDLKVHKLEDTNIREHPIVSQFFTHPDPQDKLICMSDTILGATEDLNAHFSIVPFSKNFQMIKSNENKSSAKFQGKTSLKRVIPTGTVSFIKDKQLPNYSIGAFAKMGYNQFITTQK